MIMIDKFTSRFCGALFVATEVDVYLRAGTAWTGVAHFPEVVVLVSVYDVVGGEVTLPVSGGFIVARQPFFG